MYETKILTIDTESSFNEAVSVASGWLKRGDLVGMPTETVYGLAANALDPAAVNRIFRVKNRPAHNPLIVHVFGKSMILRCIREWTDEMEKLAAEFWPGPLTMVTWRSDVIPDCVTAGGDTVGIRWPWHPFFQKTIRECGFPVAAPSANPANMLSPTKAQHVLETLSGKIPLIVDGGLSAVGLESTVVDMTVHPPRVLRPGMISESAIYKVLGLPPCKAQDQDKTTDHGEHSKEKAIDLANDADAIHGTANGNAQINIIKSPGQLSRHYSPKADLRIWTWSDSDELKSRARELPYSMDQIHLMFYSTAPEEANWAQAVCFPEDPEAYARALYAELHQADQLGAKCILIEAPPDHADWAAIRDRLRRAGKWES